MVGVGRKRRRAQVGIGTLVVFIAMVLVATMASGVLIDTAGFLQTKSEQTGREATDGVVSRLQVTSKVGRVSGTGDRNYIVIEENGQTARDEPYDKRLTFPEGEQVRLDTVADQKLLVEGKSSPTYAATGGTTYRISRVGNEIRFTDTGNGVVVNTVEPPVTLSTSADADVELGYPGSRHINHEDQVDFGATLDGGDTATARFVKPDRIWTANLTVAAGPGVDAVDLTEATVIYRSQRRVRYLSYAADGEPNHTAFAVSTVSGNGDGVLRDGEQAKITIDVDGVERYRHGLPLGERAEVTIVTENAKTKVFLNPPNTAGGRPHVEL